MDMNRTFLIIGAMSFFINGSYLLIQAIHYRRWAGALIVNLIIAATSLYVMVIYILALLGILGIPGYGNEIRPILSMIALAPMAISLLHKGYKK